MLAAILALALLLRLPGFTESVWFDELASTRVVLDNFTALLRVVATDAHPPFYAVVMFIWIHLFGDSEISIRVPPLVFGLLTIALTARLAAEYAGPRAGLVAAFVLAISPPHIWYSQEARQYSLLLLLVVLCTLAFHKLRQSPSARWYAVYAVVAFCMVFTHYFAIAYLAAFTLLAFPDRRLRARMLWIGGVIASVLAFYLFVRWRSSSLPTTLGHLRVFGLSGTFRLMLEWFIIGGALGRPAERMIIAQVGVIIVQLFLLGALIRGLWHANVAQPPGAPRVTRWDEFSRRWELTLLLFILPLALTMTGLIGAKHYYVERSALSALPFFAIAIGIGIASFDSARWRILSMAVIACFGAVVLANYYAKTDRFTVYYPNPDWRAGAQWLRERSGQENPVVTLSSTEAEELLYYDRALGLADTHALSANVSAEERRPGSLRQRLKDYMSPPPDTLRGRTRRLYQLVRPGVPAINDLLARERVSEFFVVTNRVVVQRDRMRDALASDPGFRIEEVFEPKGLRLLRVRRIAGDPSGG
jgi:4-amino-4-deoxy-L-arabinose transferase-like glycosyltransferase